jgi:hypothetical protein
MWFAFPKGVDRITVERQEFRAETKDVQGRDCFRCPEHFAPKILAIAGFILAGELDANAPADVPNTNLDLDAAVRAMAAQKDANEMEIRGLREDLVAANAKLAALMETHATLQKAHDVALDKIDELTDELEDKPAAATVTAAAKTGTK